jgi:hypothetical protein
VKVHANVGGSFVVVYLNPQMSTYIDARKDIRHPDFSFIEVVRNGKRVHEEIAHNNRAAELIIDFIKLFK